MIRNLRREEWGDFMSLLEKSYGYGPGWFMQHYGDLYDAERTPMDCFFVMEKNGSLVSHVGLFPIRITADGVEMEIGGIGGVATLPEERGQGHMHTLMEHVILHMQERKTPLSALWGVRQRYLPYGYENAGQRAVIGYSQASLLRNHIAPDATLRGVPPEDAAPQIRGLHDRQRFRAIRSQQHAARLRRPGLRIWVGDEGYLCATNKPEHLHVHEIVSPGGKETSMLLAAMQACSNENAQILRTGNDAAGVAGLLPCAESWTVQPEAMFRIMNCPALLSAFQPLLQARAAELGLRDFALSIGIRCGGRVDVAGIELKSGTLSITSEKIAPHCEIESDMAARLFIGGPGGGTERLGPLAALLPLPICIPQMDKV
jgi:predicted N-acetyltransferase YhbS